MSGIDQHDKQDQLDEVEVLQAMSKEGEFEWEEDKTSGAISGTLNVFLRLESPINFSLARARVEQCSPNKSTPSTQDQSSGASCSAGPSVPDKRSDKTVEILHLPPSCLHFQFPSNYPSEHQPTFTLSCKWMNFTQLSLICHQLDQIWEHTRGGVVLYEWQQFLANDLLSYLGITNELSFEFEDPSAPMPRWDPRVVQDIEHPLHLLPSLVEYDKRGREQLFADSFFSCDICLLSLQGSKCIKVSCGHIHCRECLTSHITIKIGSGDVTKIDCPSGDCEEIITPSVVKELVTPPVFERYDKLLLQRTLDSMHDVIYCPRPSCRCVTVKDDTDMAQCPRCVFSFCVLCRRAWHGIAPCKLLSSGIKELRDTWDSLDDESKQLLEKQYGKARLHQAFQEFDSHQWIDSNAKKCPQCRANIQKDHGCNKMTCSQCRSSFCWLCDAPLQKANPYAHFSVGNSACAGKLFEGMEVFGEDDFFF